MIIRRVGIILAREHLLQDNHSSVVDQSVSISTTTTSSATFPVLIEFHDKKNSSTSTDTSIGMMEDPRVGLSIDSGSASCASDLSDSQASWEDYELRDDDASILFLPSSVRDLPRTPSFRSRIPRREEEEQEDEDEHEHTLPRRRRETATSWDDDVRIARHPRAPSLRFCLTLFTLTLVLLSLTNTGNGKTGIQELEFRKETTLLLSSSEEESRSNAPRNNGSSPSPQPLVKNTKQLLPVTGGEMKSSHGSVPTSRNGVRTRTNLAMARSAERRPVFGATPPLERIILEDKTQPKMSSSNDDSSFASNWTSWLAAVALIAMLLETGYKEYRLCRMDDHWEQQRRL